MLNMANRYIIGKTDMSVSPIAFGCWGIVSTNWGVRLERKEIHKILDVAWAVGINLFDTAAVYGDGLGELIFECIPWKNEAIIATKISARQKPTRPLQSIKEYYPQTYVLSQVEGSLRRLGRDYIDVLQLHNWYNEWAPEAEYVFGVLHNLKQQGKIRAVGVSLPDWANVKLSDLLPYQVIDVIQAPINLFQQWAIDHVALPAQQHNIGIFARSPLDHGSLAALEERVKDLPYSDLRRHLFAGDRIVQLGERVRDICHLASITKQALPFYAIAYCSAQPGVTSVIVGMRNAEHVRDNTTSANYKFTPDQISKAKYCEWLRGW